MQIFGTPSSGCEPKYASNSAVFWHYSRVCWRLAPHQIYRREKAYCSKSTEGKLHKCNYKFFNGMNQCEFVCCLAAVLFCFVISCYSVYWHGMAWHAVAIALAFTSSAMCFMYLQDVFILRLLLFHLSRFRLCMTPSAALWGRCIEFIVFVQSVCETKTHWNVTDCIGF